LKGLIIQTLKIRGFWNIAPCSTVEVERRFRVAYYIHHQDDDDGGSISLWNVGVHQRGYTALNLR
jgi:hypothetical protein